MIKAKIHCSRVIEELRDTLLYRDYTQFLSRINYKRIGSKITNKDIEKVISSIYKYEGEEYNYESDSLYLECYLDTVDRIVEPITNEKKDELIDEYETFMAHWSNDDPHFKSSKIKALRNRLFPEGIENVTNMDIEVNPANENSLGVEILRKNGFYVDPDEINKSTSICCGCIHRFVFQMNRYCIKNFQLQLEIVK